LEKVHRIVQYYVYAAGLLQHEKAHQYEERFPDGGRREVSEHGRGRPGVAAVGQVVQDIGQFLVGKRRFPAQPHQRLTGVRHSAFGRQPRRRLRRQVHRQEAKERREGAQDADHLPRHDRTQ